MNTRANQCKCFSDPGLEHKEGMCLKPTPSERKREAFTDSPNGRSFTDENLRDVKASIDRGDNITFSMNLVKKVLHRLECAEKAIEKCKECDCCGLDEGVVKAWEAWKKSKGLGAE